MRARSRFVRAVTSCLLAGRPITVKRVATPTAREDPMSDRKPRILIVDDEPDLLTVLRFGLEAAGFEVVQASDGEQGLALARQVMPDLMILDLMLPRMDGYKVCRALKFDERYKRIPIFILSARSGEVDR